MIKLISNQALQPVAKTKSMYEMESLEVCVVVTKCSYVDHVVMRTAYGGHFEVIDLTAPRTNSCWVHDLNFQVRELYPGETYTLELS